MKAQTVELEKATDTVAVDIQQLGESVSKAIISHLNHFHHLRGSSWY